MHFYTHFGSIELWGTLLRQTTEEEGYTGDVAPGYLPQSGLFNQDFANGLVIS